MNAKPPLKIYIVTGENSGDALGADILSAFRDNNIAYELGGLAGPQMTGLGAKSLFDISQLSLMGITAVIGKLPTIYKLVRKVVNDVSLFKPDILVLIDSPDFNYAVARRVKKHHPNIPIVKYICPSVWAWRQGRAKKMTAFIDHVLAILPFEADLMKKLGGPPTTYVGHPLVRELKDIDTHHRADPGSPVKLLILPGSRKGEVKRLLPVIRDTLALLHERGVAFEATLPAVDNLVGYITDQTSDWSQKPNIITGKVAKKAAFENADLALACSGTVMLELGLYSIPTISIYKLDELGFVVRYLVKTWTACLPNLITDKVVIPERFDEYANPQVIARLLQDLCTNGPARDLQIDGFQLMRDILQRDQKSNFAAASKILQIAGRTGLIK